MPDTDTPTDPAPPVVNIVLEVHDLIHVVSLAAPPTRPKEADRGQVGE